MGVYRYKHEWCGFDQDLMLENEERENVVIACYRCGRNVSARLVRDKSTNIKRAADGTVGITRHERKSKTRRRGLE